MKIRLFVNETLEVSKTIAISKENQHYLQTVLKVKVGEEVFVFNSTNGEYKGKIYKEGRYYFVKITQFHRKEEYPYRFKLHIACAVIKSDKYEEILQKCTQIGAFSFNPIITQYSNSILNNMERYNKITIEATEQSNRITPPTINKTQNLTKFLQNAETGTIIFCDERQVFDKSAINLLNKILAKDLFLLVGPEGGFSEQERRLILSQKNTIPISLGQNILRAETATICAAFMLSLINL